MAELAATLPDAHIARTYTKDYADTDTESEMESQIEIDNEDEDLLSISLRLEQNQEYLDHQIAPPSGEASSWILEQQSWKTTEGTNVVLVRKPTASNMSHRLLNPFIYRNIQNVGSLNDLARMLESPLDWEAQYNRVVQDGRILRKTNMFRSLPEETPESYIQFEFASIVSQVALYLEIGLRSLSETKIIVGGILSRYQYDIRSKSDPHFAKYDGSPLLASEVKTHRTFGDGEMWYHSSRGIQVLTALYAFNAPTFLLTQQQWKLFVENKERNAVFTFPYNDEADHTPHVNSSLVHGIGTTFLKAIVICLLSQRHSADKTKKSMATEFASQQTETPKKSIIKSKFFQTPDKPSRTSSRLMNAFNNKEEKKSPQFISGYVNGEAQYSTVRVLSPDLVKRIEDEIAFKEKSEMKQKTSEPTSQITLVE